MQFPPMLEAPEFIQAPLYEGGEDGFWAWVRAVFRAMPSARAAALRAEPVPVSGKASITIAKGETK
jgi:hypothetical protein